MIPVPYANFAASARCLSNEHLLSLRTNLPYLIDAVRKDSVLSFVQAWREHEQALTFYYFVADKEITVRGGDPDSRSIIADVSLPFDYPAWWGDEAVHSSHRAYLLYLGRKAALSEKVSPAEITRHGFRSLRFLGVDDLKRLEGLYGSGGNWYSQFGWTEPDDGQTVTLP